jgi:enoyl-CoA hydratase/carnithine racemase
MNLSDLKYLLYSEPEPSIAVVQLNRPEVTNALSLELQAEISAIFDKINQNDAIRVVVLTGGQDNFAAGGDINSLSGCGPIEIYKRHTELVWAPIQNCPKPVIAAVNGYALGGGCELAMHCDIIIAGENALFGQPEIKIGIMPGIGGTQRLLRAVGKFQAMKMLLTGKPISSQEARLVGLVSDVVPDEQTLDTALKMAKTIARMPPLAVAQIKEVVSAGLDMPLESALLLERKANQLLFSTKDQKEGMAAFIEKREAKFNGE